MDVEGMAVLYDDRWVDAGENPRCLSLRDDLFEQFESTIGIRQAALAHVSVGAERFLDECESQVRDLA
ncbi:hypothetical protein [Saccharopolyspora sp. NPDC049357]|uniref:hypothetical protein n=1 Tax=Saccharopolyspora sp. NPDC049357 TaxID=3154507 RepID=UPI003417FA39